MEIELYPEFNEVFENDTLKGIFYTLCKVSSIKQGSFFFVSHNGIWTDENIKNENNQSEFICFLRKNGKYYFNGNLELYIGHENAKQVFETLNDDFNLNGEEYLAQKLKTELYIEKINKNLNIDFGKIDSNYYLETFYQFSINKLNYKKSGKFGAFREIIDGWGKPDKSPIVYEIKNDNSCGYADIEINKEFIFPKTIEIEKYEKIGFVEGSEFFTDGNDTYLVFDKKNGKIISVNHYS